MHFDRFFTYDLLEDRRIEVVTINNNLACSADVL